MQVINIHKRKLQQTKVKVAELFKTLATKEDKIWPFENWPAIRFENVLKVRTKGGHGIVRYTIIDFKAGESITFQFSKPKGFIGTHELYIKEIEKKITEITHEINIKTTSIKATFLWMTVIRWLHDAFQDYFTQEKN